MKYRFALLIVLACICSVLAEAKVKRRCVKTGK